MLHQTVKYAVTIVTHYNDGTAILPNYVETLVAEVAEKHGGASVETGGYGGWVNEKGELVKEGNVVLWWLCPDCQENETHAIGVARTVADDLGQECVLVSKTLVWGGLVDAAGLVGKLN